MRNRFSVGGREALFGILLLVGLIGFGTLRYPAVHREGKVGSVVVALVLSAAYAMAAWRIGRVSGGEELSALRWGAGVGLALGVVMVVHLTVEYFVDLPAPWNAVVALGLFPVLFAGFGYAGFRGSSPTGRWGLGVLAAVWSAMTCMILLCIYGFSVNFLFMSRMETILARSPDFIRSGMRDLTAFTVVNSLEACGSHMIIAPVLALLFGGIGGAAGKWATPGRSGTSGRGEPRVDEAIEGDLGRSLILWPDRLPGRA